MLNPVYSVIYPIGYDYPCSHWIDCIEYKSLKCHLEDVLENYLTLFLLFTNLSSILEIVWWINHIGPKTVSVYNCCRLMFGIGIVYSLVVVIGFLPILSWIGSINCFIWIVPSISKSYLTFVGSHSCSEDKWLILYLTSVELRKRIQKYFQIL